MLSLLTLVPVAVTALTPPLDINTLGRLPIRVPPTKCACGEPCKMNGGGSGVCQENGECAVNIKAPDCGRSPDARAPLPVPPLPIPFPKVCVCGETCKMNGGGSGVCQEDGECAVNVIAPNCGYAPDAKRAFPVPASQPLPFSPFPLHYCPQPICSFVFCPLEQQQKQYDANGCELCPKCNWNPFTCDSDDDCPVGQECAPGLYRQCRPSTQRRCWSFPSLAGSSHLAVDANSDLGLTGGVDAGLFIGFSQCPPDYYCANGYCRQCPQFRCARPACPGGVVVSTKLENGCQGCPRCAYLFDQKATLADENKP